ncbi:MAG: PIG-L family deacetylase [Acidobacteriota bacterium]
MPPPSSPHPPPPGSATEVHARRALVLAPHFDDEVIGCGGLIAQLVRSECALKVLFLSESGYLGGGPESRDLEDRRRYSAVRRAEADRALEALGGGVIESACLELPDGALEQHVGSLAEAIGEEIAAWLPDLVLAPAPSERSADHRAAFTALARRLAGVREGDPLAGGEWRILLYEINHALDPDLLVRVEEQMDTLEAAMACYASQLEKHDYWSAARGRRLFRAHTLPPGTGAVEAYRELRLIDFQSRGPEALWRFLGVPSPPREIVDGPQISVIVRTRDRAELLAEALASLRRSTYRRLQVVVVNDGGETPSLPEDFPFELRLLDLSESRGRAGAANAGIAAAEGEYVAFLDDDDLVEAEHYETLIGLASAAGVRVAYTDAAVVVYRLSGEAGWREDERRLTYSRDFDADLLALDNYIPLHTLLIERRLLAEVGELDETLPFFEDWDLLLRLASRTPFHHLARVTCEYRQFRGAGHHVLGDQPRERPDFLAMKTRVLEKHQSRLQPARLAKVVDCLRAETVAAEERSRAALASREAWERQHHEVRGSLRAAQDRQLQLQAVAESARADLEHERARLEGLKTQLGELQAFGRRQGDELEAAHREIGRLTAAVEAMESTRVWRWYRRFVRGRP